MTRAVANVSGNAASSSFSHTVAVHPTRPITLAEWASRAACSVHQAAAPSWRHRARHPADSHLKQLAARALGSHQGLGGRLGGSGACRGLGGGGSRLGTRQHPAADQGHGSGREVRVAGRVAGGQLGGPQQRAGTIPAQTSGGFGMSAPWLAAHSGCNTGHPVHASCRLQALLRTLLWPEAAASPSPTGIPPQSMLT